MKDADSVLFTTNIKATVGSSSEEAFRVIDASKPSRLYRAAVVGCGRMGSTIDDEHIGMPHYPWPWAHAPAIIEARNVELAAASDVDEGKLEDFGRRWGVKSLYQDYRKMVERESLDLVAVTTGPGERAEVVIGLAEAGVKAIFATKPMCRKLAEADAMIEACRKHGVILAIACHLNWYGWYTRARELIADGTIGSLRSMICHNHARLSNLQSHTLALFRLFAGAHRQVGVRSYGQRRSGPGRRGPLRLGTDRLREWGPGDHEHPV